MKNITEMLVKLLKEGYCTPQISQIAKRLKEPVTTIHYNIKKLEKDGTIRKYKTVFDNKKIDEGFSSFVLISLAPDEYGNPEKIGKELAKLPQVESVDMCTGDFEIILKVRTKDQDNYYNLIKHVISRKGIIKIKSLTSLKQLKTEFVES